jgi:tetratricopeptide (TPR) repeat protein
MPFSHKPRPGFELHFIPPPGCWRLGVGHEPRRLGRLAVLGALALALVALAARAGSASAEPASTAVPVAAAQVAPVAGDPGTALTASGADSEDPAAPPASPTYTGPVRTRRRTPRPAAEIRSDARPAAAPPRSMGDLNGWLEYKARAHVLALPVEARLFYRRGVLARREGKREEAERWVRAAAELDPAFVDPHLTIAAWSMPDRPSQALVHWAAALDLARESFIIQAGLAANAVFVVFQSLLAAVLIAGLIIVVLRLPELSHPWRERLGGLLRPETARWWAFSFTILPFLAGVGVVLPTIVFLGLLWPVLRARERAIFVLLTVGFASIPWTAALVDRLATPLDPERAPLYGIALIENEPWSGARQSRLAAVSAREPDNPFLHFALAWTARRGGDLATAEREYRSALDRWPGDDRVLTNLGNVLAMQGKQDEALEVFQKAIAARPTNPAPYFNESQIYTQRYEYVDATEALSRASAIDFDLVRDYQALGTSDGVLALVDQWIAPRNFWLALRDAPASTTVEANLPPPWRGHLETTGWRFSLIAMLCGLLAVIAGFLGHRALPLRACSNCGRVVCRRCAQRRREVALCRGCAALETRAQNPDFARVLLRRGQRQTEKVRDVIRTILAALVPGFGLIAFRRAVTPLLLIAGAVMLVGPWAGAPLPFELEPLVGLSDRLPPLGVRIALGVVIYAVSIAGYFSCVARARRVSAVLSGPPSRAAQGAPGPRTLPGRAA